MPITIELRIQSKVADGAELWWDDVEAALPEDASRLFPLLNRIDPYGDLSLTGSELRQLGNEIRLLLETAPMRTQPLLIKLANLCDKGARADEAELRFVGD